MAAGSPASSGSGSLVMRLPAASGASSGTSSGTSSEPEEAGVRGGLGPHRADLADLTLAERARSSPRRDPRGTLVGSSSGGGGGGSLGSSGSSCQMVSLTSVSLISGAGASSDRCAPFVILSSRRPKCFFSLLVSGSIVSSGDGGASRGMGGTPLLSLPDKLPRISTERRRNVTAASVVSSQPCSMER